MPDGKNEAKNSTMNLTIDMGNTRVKYAVFDGGTVVSDGCSEEFDEAVIDRILAAHPRYYAGYCCDYARSGR